MISSSSCISDDITSSLIATEKGGIDGDFNVRYFDDEMRGYDFNTRR